ncbi:transcriptional regulator [Lutibacter sp. B1]|nr:transcriptional regulator [Lutibacter sp. B1]
MHFYCFFLFIAFVNQPAFAQYAYYFKNYTLSDYKAGNQNWDITKSDDGKIYAANNEGLLEFDGLNWKLWEMPNKTIVRSVLAYNNKIYVGSYEDFGYWEKDKKGILQYTSLISSSDKKSLRSDEEFWQIVLLNKAIIFRSFSSIQIYEDGNITSYNLPSTIMACNVIDGKLLASTLNEGIFVFKNNKFEQFLYSQDLLNAKIISIDSIKPNQFLLTTALKGCFYIDNKKITTWESEINQFIKKHQLNRFTILENGNLVFGTIKNGIYITNSKGKVLYNINKENGLLNNTVLGQFKSNNELWLGLDNGISLIDLNTANYYFNDISGKLGAVYDVIDFENTRYVGSNTGLYFIDENQNIQFIEGSQGQVWDLQNINGELFCGHNDGTYLVKNKKLKKISGYTGGWVIKKVPERNTMYIQGTYTGLVSFKKEQKEWKIKHLGKTTIPIRFLVFENEYTAWVAHAYKGLYKVRFNKNYDSIVDFKNYSNKGLWSDFNVRIHKINNMITFHTLKGWQKYESLLDSIVPFDLLNEKLGEESYIISEDNISKAVIKTENAIAFNSLEDESKFVPNRFYKKRIISGYENISKINDSIYALNLYDGFMLINLATFSKNISLSKPIIEEILVNNKNINIDTSIIELPFRKNNLLVAVSSPESKNFSFKYKLLNSDITSNWKDLKQGKVELSNLMDGDYELLIKTVDDTNNESTISKLPFTVLTPWYKNKIGFAVYLFLFLVTAFLVYVLHKRKISKEQKLLKLKYEEKQKRLLEEKEMENEKEIIKLKNESLKNEVKLKSKQLANTAMALVKKNEILSVLKKELLLHKRSFENQYSFKKMIKQIDNSIEHEDEWKLFEYNFNQVHEEFFNQLKLKYPNLTHKELKICAYLKMNLTTKEIAQLINISVRGVETLRYRLKKKLNLSKEDSLRQFLQNFH